MIKFIKKLPNDLKLHIKSFFYPFEIFGKKKYLKDIDKYQFLCKKCENFNSFEKMCYFCIYKNTKLFRFTIKDYNNRNAAYKIIFFLQLNLNNNNSVRNYYNNIIKVF